MKVLKEFQEFAIKGNVVDLAVGVIIGGAFGKIVSTLTDKVIMPPIGMAMGRMKFTDYKYVLQAASKAADGTELKEVAIGYGELIQVVVDFAILAFVIFMMVRAINKLKAKPAEKPPEPSAQEKLLAEIRDLLRQRA